MFRVWLNIILVGRKRGWGGKEREGRVKIRLVLSCESLRLEDGHIHNSLNCFVCVLELFKQPVTQIIFLKQQVCQINYQNFWAYSLKAQQCVYRWVLTCHWGKNAIFHTWSPPLKEQWFIPAEKKRSQEAEAELMSIGPEQLAEPLLQLLLAENQGTESSFWR